MIERNALAHPNVTMFRYGSVLQLNKERNWDYPVMVLSPRVTTVVNGLYQFGFVLWYIDILDKERTRVQEIQSEAIQALMQVSNAIIDEDAVFATASPISVFSERFNDTCAGAMLDLTVTTAAEICPPQTDVNITYHNHFQGAEFESKAFSYLKGSTQSVKKPTDDDLNYAPPVPQLHFDSWNTDPLGNGASYKTGDTINLTEDVELYTIWIE